jgi:hypothetical protein
MIEDWESLEYDWEERAAIREFDGGFSRYEAEQLAAQDLGFENKAAFKSHIQKMKAESEEKCL